MEKIKLYTKPDKRSLDEKVKDGLSEIIGNRNASGTRTTKKDIKRFRDELYKELKNV
jgi:hypothetical protein